MNLELAPFPKVALESSKTDLIGKLTADTVGFGKTVILTAFTETQFPLG